MERTELNAQPVVLDVDGSVGTLPGELRLPLQDWQEQVRFGCGLRRFAQFRAALDAQLPAAHGTALMGSGDFHHLSWPLIERCITDQALSAGRPLRVVVLDNHPDNMRFPWGVHCGSWVRRVALHPAVSHVHVAGITSGDIGRAHAWENYLTPLRAGRLSYWSAGVDTGWARRLGVDVKTIQRLCARELGMTFGQWRQQARLLHALERLARGEKVLDVALALGYESPSAFATMFKRQFGETPSAYFR